MITESLAPSNLRPIMTLKTRQEILCINHFKRMFSKIPNDQYSYFNGLYYGNVSGCTHHHLLKMNEGLVITACKNSFMQFRKHFP